MREAVPRLPKVQKKYCCMMGAGAKLRSPDTRAAQKKLTATPPKRRYVTEALKERRPKRATKKEIKLHHQRPPTGPMSGDRTARFRIRTSTAPREAPLEIPKSPGSARGLPKTP